MSMKILSLTSDFGSKDFYLAAFKGLIYRELDNVSIIDISHDTPPYEIQSAAYNLKNTWPLFPEQSLHVFRVGESNQKEGRYLCIKKENQFFILPDNGVITLIFENVTSKIIALQKENEAISSSAFLAKAIAHILKAQEVESLGKETTNFQERITQQPILSQSYIRGVVQHVDRYGNVVTNITKELFESQIDDSEFVIETRAEKFYKIKPSYFSVSPGTKLATFNSAGFLQISINHGNASDLFGLSIGDVIQIDMK